MPTGGLSAAEPVKAARQPDKKDVVVAIALPWLIFFVIVALFLFTYHDMAIIVWVLIVLCIALSLLFLILGMSVGLKSFIAIGLLCLGSTFVATTVGMWISDEYLERYYKFDDSNLQSVDPTVAPDSKAQDVSVFNFINDTFIDDARTVGFVAGGDIYCVAPVSFPEKPDVAVQYWATGVNCCEQRSNFDCGAARDPEASSGVVADDYAEMYHKAILMAQAIHGLGSTNTSRFVNIINSADAMQGGLWDEALSVGLSASIVDLAFSLGAGFMLWKVLISSNQQVSLPFGS